MAPDPKLAILIMAAGQARRMGRDKLLMRSPDGTSLLQGRLRAACATPYPVFVALPPNNEPRKNCVAHSPARAVICPDARRGMGHSLSHAIAEIAKGLDGVLILLADMPDISTRDILLICKHYHPDHVVRGCDNILRCGHPVLVPATILPRLNMLTQDAGAASVLRNLPTCYVTLPDHHASRDIDTEEDWIAWLGHHNRGKTPPKQTRSDP